MALGKTAVEYRTVGKIQLSQPPQHGAMDKDRNGKLEKILRVQSPPEPGGKTHRKMTLGCMIQVGQPRKV
jgi:hypothetical protein